VWIQPYLARAPGKPIKRNALLSDYQLIKGGLMKKTILLSCLFLCALYIGAQTYPGQSSNPPSSQTMDHQTRVRGCLSGSSGNYSLTDKSGNTYQLTGDTSKLAEHVGHTVEIIGTAAPSRMPSSGASSGSSSTATGAGSAGMSDASARTVNVSSVKHVSETCGASH
jgi:hypothetical protein